MTALSLKTVDVRSRIDPQLKESASDILVQCGLDISTAIRLFLQNVVAYKGIPFDIRVPNAETAEAMREVQNMKTARFATAQELFDDLDKNVRTKKN